MQILEINKEQGIYELILPDVKPEDAGEYRVVASNKYSDESCSCVVTVTSMQLLNFIILVKTFYNCIFCFFF